MPSLFHVPTWLQTDLPSSTYVPPLSKHIQKLIHSLPFIIFLLASFILLCLSMFLSILTFILDGPIRPQWSLATHLMHSLLKTSMVICAPQGRHSMKLVRSITTFYLPAWFFPKVSITLCKFTIDGYPILSEKVNKIMGMSPIFDTSLDKLNCHGDWIAVKNVYPSKTSVILYLHGGAHLFLSSKSQRSITTQLASVCSCPVYALDYRLSPEHRFPSAVKDALGAYSFLLNSSFISDPSISIQGDESHSFENIFIMADSSGCCLALQLLYVLREFDMPMPKGLVFLSPFVDHELKMSSWHFNANTDFMALDVRGMKWALGIYANGRSLSDPFISPLTMDMSEFPPLLIQVGDCETVYCDAIELHKTAIHTGLNSELQIFKDMFHVFQLFPFVPEHQEAFKRIKHFYESKLIQNPSSEFKKRGIVLKIKKFKGIFIEEIDFINEFTL